MKISEIDINSLTPMMKQYVDIKLENSDKILFFRLGEFYEMFFEDAILVSNLLEIALTKKSAGLEERIPMCGVPAHSYLGYLEKLVELGYRVAICEQLEEAGNSKLVKRGIVQVYTPGTIIKEDTSISYIGSYANGILTYVNISTGEMFTGKFNSIVSQIEKLGIKELVCFDCEIECDILVSKVDEVYNFEYLYNDLPLEFHLGIDVLITYVEKLYCSKLIHIKKAVLVVENASMKLSNVDLNTLEIFSTIRQNTKFGSLFWYLDRCNTAMGSRLLRHWLEFPLLNKSEIILRQEKVKLLIDNYHEANDIARLLKSIYDLERICAKISVQSANARDLLWLKNSLVIIPKLNKVLDNLNIELLNEFSSLYELLEDAINDDAPISIKDGNLIKSGYNRQIDELRNIDMNGKQWLVDLEIREKDRTGIKNLKVKYNRVFGYFIEVSNANLHLVKEEFGYERKQTITNGERFITRELKEQEDLILNASDRLVKLEYDVFLEIRNIVKDYVSEIQLCASHIASLDCHLSLANVADEDDLVCPSFNDSQIVEVINSKHPVIEMATKSLFVANDINFNTSQSVMIITGPNMSGKSTYMRQMAIIAIMAQIGSFVPCSSANLPIFDAIFTRIGASDDLSSGKSTFMVEMIEASNALNNATKNSLILFDELGRGTSTYDGISISHAIIEYVSSNIGAKTLFSTHYHELTKLENNLIFNVHASAVEEGDKVIFRHLIKNGAADKSYGIYVASLAGINNTIINSAKTILSHYEDNVVNNGVKIEYVNVESKVENELNKLDLNSVTPLDAINILDKLKNIK